MNIQDVIQNSNSINQLHAISKQCTSNISLFGRCYISHPNYKGTANTDQLATRILTLVANNLEFSEGERFLGIQITDKIDKLYLDGRKLQEKANIFTRILCLIKNIIARFFPNDNQINERNWFAYDGYLVFNHYTANQHQEIFGHVPTRIPDELFNDEPRWQAPTKARWIAKTS